MHVKFFHFILVISLVLFFQACGSNSAKQLNEVHVLTEDNFVSLAKYHFFRKSRELLKSDTSQTQNNKKFRSYPGANQLDNQNESSLKIRVISPFNSYIESMRIISKDRVIILEVKNKIYVNIFLYEGGTLLKKITQTMNDFKNFELDEMMGAL